MTKIEDGKCFFDIINGQGEVQFKFNDGQYSEMTNFNQGHAFVIEGDHISLLDSKGKKVQNVGNGRSLTGLSYSDGKFIYSDGEFFGVKDTEGIILIRAKYQYLEFINNDELRALNSSNKYGVVDTNDNIIVPFDYTSLDYVAPDRYFTTSGSATGSYNYTISGNGQKIAISGSYIGDTTLSYSLTEYYDGNPCGEWEFTVTITGKSPASRQ